MIGFKYYSWSVSMEDGTRLSYDFQIEDDAPWTDVLKRFGEFLGSEGYEEGRESVNIICYELEQELDAKLAGTEALKDYHSQLDMFDDRQAC
jgi:hypothetical protein